MTGKEKWKFTRTHRDGLSYDWNLLPKDPHTWLLFHQVYSSDTLPPNAEEGLYIVNEAKLHEPGTHWISLHITPKKRKIVYFNSYNQKPTLKEIKNFLGHKYIYNNKTVQHMLFTSCSQLCMYFVWRCSENWKTNEITSPFSMKKPLVNDYEVNYLIEQKFRTDQEVLDKKFLTSQICKQMKQVLMAGT